MSGVELYTNERGPRKRSKMKNEKWRGRGREKNENKVIRGREERR